MRLYTRYNFWFTYARALVRLNQRRVCVSRTLVTRHGNNIMESVPTVLSPTMNLDSKRGFRGEENVSGSKEPAEENTPEIS